MKKNIIFLILFFYSIITVLAQSFKEQQLKYSRVNAAYKEKWEGMHKLLQEKKINEKNFEIFIRAFKKEEIVEVWAKSKTDRAFKLLKSYKICSSSGELGPKRKQGDYQVPEGFYHIQVFNPYSSYHLSLGVSYPNQSDRILGKGNNLGGDIMIHGSCVTIGCIPLTDKYIKEVYILAVEAKNGGQSKIPVHIFPTLLSGEQYSNLIENNIANAQLVNFWKNLKIGFDFFEKNKSLPKVSVDNQGKYVFQ